MILRLLRHDRAMVAILALWPGGAILGYMIAEVLGGYAAAGHHPDPISGIAAYLFAVVFSFFASVNYFSGGGVEVASRFLMALPIRARDLWVARMISVYAPFGGAVVVAGVTFCVAVEGSPGAGQVAAAVNAAALAAFIPALYHSARVGYAQRGMPLPLFLPVLLASLSICAIEGVHSLIPAAMLGGAAVVLLVVTYMRVPASFELAEGPRSRTPVRVPVVGTVTEQVAELPGMGRAVRLWAALRPRRWLNRDQFTLLILLGVSVNVLLLLRSPLSALVTPVILQAAWLIRTINGASRIDHLPLRRGRIFDFAILPPLAAFALVAGVALLWSGTLTVRAVAASDYVAASALVYATVWMLSVVSILSGLTPGVATGWRGTLRRPATWAWAILVAIVGVTRVGAPEGRGVLATLATWLPLSAAQLWAIVAALLVVSYLGLRKRFAGVEIVTLSRGMVV